MKPIPLELMCELSSDELHEKAQQLSSAAIHHDEVDAAKRNAMKEYNDELKTLRGTMRELSNTIRQKAEQRLVECAVRFHVPEVGMKRIVRSDTNAIVRDEPMTFEERQSNLFEEIGDLTTLYGSGPTDEQPQQDPDNDDFSNQ